MRIRMAGRISTAALAAALLASGVQAQDVLMRRPLPSSSTPSQGCDATGTCTTPTPTPPPTPTPTPAPTCTTDSLGNTTCTPTPTPGPTPSPTPTPTPVQTPTPTPTPAPNCFYTDMEWTTGGWDGTGGQCGQDSHLTRDVGCHAKGTCYDASWRNPTTVDEDVDPSVCESHIGWNFSSGYGPDNILGPEPSTSYDGTGAGCTYTAELVSATNWQDPGYGPVDHQCSPDTYQDRTYDCVDDSGQQVPFSFCTDGISLGGTPSTDYPSGANTSSDPMIYVGRNFGNLSDCHYGWVTYDANSGGTLYRTSQCDDNHQYTATLDYKCERTDGLVVDDADCAAYQRPPSTLVEACVPSYYNDSGDGIYNNHACRGDAAEVVIHVIIGSVGGAPNGDLAGIDDSQACYDAGATCCELRAPYINYGGSDAQNQLYLYGTKGYPTNATYGEYADTSEPAADPSQGPAYLIATQSGSLHWVPYPVGPDQGLQISDPQGVLFSDRNLVNPPGN